MQDPTIERIDNLHLLVPPILTTPNTIVEALFHKLILAPYQFEYKQTTFGQWRDRLRLSFGMTRHLLTRLLYIIFNRKSIGLLSFLKK